MKINIKNFIEGLNIVEKGLTNKESLIYMKVEMNKLVLFAQNNEVKILNTQIIDSCSNLEVVLDINSINVLKSMPNDFNIERKENSLLVECGRVKREISITNSSEFTLGNDNDESVIESFNISKDTIELLNDSIYCRSLDDTRPILTGICIKEGKAATIDGFRLVEKSIPELKNESAFIIKADRIPLLKNLENTIKVSNKENWVEFNDEKTSISIRKFSGDFVPYETLLRKHDKTLRISPVEAYASLQRIKIISNDIVTKLTLENGKFFLKAMTKKIKGSEELENVSYKNFSNEFSINFNTNYLIDLIKANISEPFIDLFISDDNKYVIVESSNSLSLIMPIALK